MHENKKILQPLWLDTINMICWILHDLKHTIVLIDLDKGKKINDTTFS